MRQGRWSACGRVYLITTITSSRMQLFTRHDAARIACRSFLKFEREGASSLVAWVLMPDHVHWVVQLGAGESLSQTVNRLKSGSSRNIGFGMAAGGRVWERGFHDRAMRADDDLVVAARYVIANPLRAGLVERVGDYPYWDCKYL